MWTYRLDLLGSDGLVEGEREITCIDDEEALLRARSLGHAQVVIVWQEHRRIGEVRDGIMTPRTQVS